MTDTFNGPKLKIKRAKQHVCDFHARMLAFQASDFYSLIVDKDPETGSDIFHYRETKPLPDDLALIVGDALHNLRGALDIALNAAVRSRLGRTNRYTKFTFSETRDKLVTAINRGLVHQASKTIADFIVDSVKPYNGGNDALGGMYRLNVLDKHRLLIPVMRVTALHDLRFEDDRGQELSVGIWLFTGNQFSMKPFPNRKNLKVTNKGKPSLLVLFDKGLPFQGEAILPTLKQFVELVSGIVEGIETLFLAGG